MPGGGREETLGGVYEQIYSSVLLIGGLYPRTDVNCLKQRGFETEPVLVAVLVLGSYKTLFVKKGDLGCGRKVVGIKFVVCGTVEARSCNDDV